MDINGFDDWFLPSRNELAHITKYYTSSAYTGGIPFSNSTYYWSINTYSNYSAIRSSSTTMRMRNSRIRDTANTEAPVDALSYGTIPVRKF